MLDGEQSVSDSNIGVAAGTEAAAEAEETQGTAEPTLEEQLAAAKAQAAENWDGKMRALAEFQNYKRRMERELQQARQYAAGSALSRVIPVLDDLELALGSLTGKSDSSAWQAGVSLVQRKFRAAIEAEDIKLVGAEPGQQFDPAVHEAIVQEDSKEFAAGTIIAVVRHGYQLGERILRPAQVRVAK